MLAGTDDLGRIAAETLVDGLKKAGHESGNIIAITGPAAQGIVTLTRAAFEKEMAKSPEYKIVATEDGAWDPAKTQKITQQLLAKNASSGGIQGIWAQADYMASGSIQAVKQAGQKPASTTRASSSHPRTARPPVSRRSRPVSSTAPAPRVRPTRPMPQQTRSSSC
ncbi:substrate-binding domain-containing protein [Aeromicrobium sp. UC242_57]|uniref:substrate-binding domain-containing protein n=1 Tax=Aeromicrobium sp. UC242_57 TaxID=3374624 RepID=UPI0037A4C9D6